MVGKLVVHTADQLDTYPNLSALVNSFQRFKSEGVFIKAFGDDCDYGWPTLCKDEELRHLHIIDISSKFWDRKYGHRTSDVHLVYCQSYFSPEHYLLIDILTPDAHDQANNMDTMLELGKAAEEFRSLSHEDLETLFREKQERRARP